MHFGVQPGTSVLIPLTEGHALVRVVIGKGGNKVCHKQARTG